MAPNSTLYPFLELEAGSVPFGPNFHNLTFSEPSSGFTPGPRSASQGIKYFFELWGWRKKKTGTVVAGADENNTDKILLKAFKKKFSERGVVRVEPGKIKMGKSRGR